MVRAEGNLGEQASMSDLMVMGFESEASAEEFGVTLASMHETGVVRL